MENTEKIQVEVQLETKKLEDDLTELKSGIYSAVIAVNNLKNALHSDFASTLVALGDIEAGVSDAGSIVANEIRNMTDAMKNCFGELLTQISDNLTSIKDIVRDELTEGNRQDTVSNLIGGLNLIFEMAKSNETEDKSAAPSGKILALPPGKPDAGGDVVDAADNILGLFSSELPTGGLLSSIGGIGQACVDMGTKIGGFFSGVGSSIMGTLMPVLSGAASGIMNGIGAAFSLLTSPMGLVTAGIAALIAVIALLVANWDAVKETAASVWAYIQEVWSGVSAWFDTNILQPLANGFQGAVNGIIGFINGMISGVVDGINAVIHVLNGLHFTIPEWVPVFGGESIGFHLTPMQAPQIPYLAKGAVLPANKPFLAMVGDQRHGTNIEAPLATIQEAVALEMESVIDAMAQIGSQMLAEQRRLRGTVEGIELGDATIGQAAARYNHRMAIVRGG